MSILSSAIRAVQLQQAHDRRQAQIDHLVSEIRRGEEKYPWLPRLAVEALPVDPVACLRALDAWYEETRTLVLRLSMAKEGRA